MQTVRYMELYEVMKEDAILGPFTIDEIGEFVHSGLILRRDYAYNIANPDDFKNVDYFLKANGRQVTVEHKGYVVFGRSDFICIDRCRAVSKSLCPFLLYRIILLYDVGVVFLLPLQNRSSETWNHDNIVFYNPDINHLDIFCFEY